MEAYRFDTVIAGGGISGVCAAIASAREGAATALVQNRPVLGGNSSSEIRVWTRGSVGGGTLYAEEMGILGELKLHNLHINPDYNPVLWDEVLLDKVLAEKNITLFLNTNITDVQMQAPGRINAVIANRLGTEEQFKISARMFVDATGDGTVGYFANAGFRIGRESMQEFGESLGVPVSDGYREGSTIMFQSKEEEKAVPFVKPDYAYDIPHIEAILNRGGRIVNEKMNGCDYWWLEYGGQADTILQNQDITFELKKLQMGIWNYIKNSGRFHAENLTLEWLGNLPGKRESRRFIGNYTLTQNDIETGRQFEDGVCYGGWFMDFHPSAGIYSEKEFCTQIPVLSYNIPMRCFYTDEIQNLVFSGRNISATHAAFSSTRIMDTCGQIGQVSGTIAAFCAKNDLSPGIAYEKHLTAVQQILLKNDLTVWGLKNTDPQDRALNAFVSASETRLPENRHADGLLELDQEAFLAVPKTPDLNFVDVEIECRHSTVLECSIYSSFLPSRRVDQNRVCSFKASVAKGQPFLRFDLGKVPNDSYAKIVIQENPSVSIRTSSLSMTGFLAGHRDSPRYVTPCVTADSTRVYDALNVTNGYNRMECGVNAWCSGPLQNEQWLQLSWKEETELSQLRLTFNPDLSMEIPSSISKISSEHHGFARRRGAPVELVKSFRVLRWADNGWTELAAVSDNYQRLCVVNFPPVRTSRIKIQFLETCGSPYAEVFEVRAY